MSVSDAAPLPRLGEVFFDVRGNSRSMRLSWYADTGVAVFSIWQAGMCTGTFRLPMGDLQRMIETLARGPEAPRGRERPPVTGARRRPDQDPGGYGPDEDELGLLDAGAGPAEYAAPGQRGQNGPGAPYGGGDDGTAAYPDAGYPDAGYPDAGYSDPGYGGASVGRADNGLAGHGAGARGPDGYLPPDGIRAADYPAGSDYPAASDYGTGGHPPADLGTGGHPPADYAAGPAASRRRPDGYGIPGSGEYRQGEYPAGDQAAGRPVRSAGHAGADYPTGGYGIPGSGEYRQGEYPAGDQAASRPVRSAGHAGTDYPTGGHDPGAGDYAASEHPLTSQRDASRADGDPDYRAAAYGSHRANQAGGHRGSGTAPLPDPAGLPLTGPGGASYGDERIVPPYVRGGEEAYLNDRRAEERDPGDTGYLDDRRSVWPSDDYVEPPRTQETYSDGAEYRRR